MSVSLKSFDNLNLVIRKVKRIPKKVKREINRIPIIQARQEAIYQASLAYHAQLLPKLSTEDKAIVNTLKTTGTYTTSIDELKLASSQKMLEEAVKLRRSLTKTSSSNDLHGFAVELNKSRLIRHPQVFLWGLETRLLNIVENYIGLPVIYQGSCLRKDLPNGKKVGVRQWHLDWEDRRTIKIIIYLNDVELDGGPYEYVSRDITTQAVKNLKYYDYRFLDDRTMAAIVSPSCWESCLGKSGTVIISDTANVLHRAKPAVKHPRYSLTFCYTSHCPEVTWNNPGVSPEQWQNIDCQLNYHQRKCLIQK